MESSTNFSNNTLSGFQNTGSTSSNGITDSFKSISPFTWFLIIIFLAFLGFNVFTYLAYGTQEIADFFGPLTKSFLGIFTAITGQVVDVTAEGTKSVVDTTAYGSTTAINTTAKAIDTGLTAIQNITPNQGVSSLKIQPINSVIQPPDIMANNALNTKLNKFVQSSNQTDSQGQINNDYQADESSSLIQSGTGKSGWCYIGEDRGFRSCVEVGPNDKCMSGDIFPTNDVCINPSLRA